jgi:glutaredoxin
MNKPILNFYYFDSCPFCRYVFEVIKNLNVKVTYENIHEDDLAMEQMRQKTGRTTVPCLFIDGGPMFESSDIIAWLEENVDNLEKNS